MSASEILKQGLYRGRSYIQSVTLSDIVRSYIEVTLQMEYLVPEKSALLQNYPNPFNPDAWIPYQLKEGTEVTIQIFSVPGDLVRKLWNVHHFQKQAGSMFYSAGSARK